jgi:hypothetical protein
VQFRIRNSFDKNHTMKKLLFASIFIVYCFGAFNARAQGTQPAAGTSTSKSVGLYVFPAKQQTPEQQSKDESECYKWAVQQSGIDPANPPKVDTAKADKSRQGEVVKGGAKGAAAGAAIGAIAGDAGKGAAIGAVAGGVAGRRARKSGDAKEEQQNIQAADNKKADQMNNFKKAFSVCLEGKGYTVK